jgi:filamentous hemagglutinin family protein
MRGMQLPQAATGTASTGVGGHRYDRLAAALLSTLVGTTLAAHGETLIEADGRTQTAVLPSADGRFEVTTATTSGRNAFNSFHHFRVAAGHEANLRLPADTDRLINLVHDSRAVIDGTVNAYRNGAIGGDVVFADPHGFLVGPTGSINVGSLGVATPTAAFMQRIVDADGIDDAAVGALLTGDFEVAGDGVIDIRGTIHAEESVRLLAGEVTVGGDITVSGTYAPQETPALALFTRAVNVEGFERASALDDRGDIVLVGEQRTEVTGSLSSLDAGGTILVTARGVTAADGSRTGGDTTVGTGAVVAAGNDGGVEISAARSVRVDGTVDASGSGDADAGIIVVAAEDHTTVGSGAVVRADSGPHGNGGAISIGRATIDSAEVTSAVTEVAGQVTARASAGTGSGVRGGTVAVHALDSATLQAGARVDVSGVDNGVGGVAGGTVTVASRGTVRLGGGVDGAEVLAHPGAGGNPATGGAVRLAGEGATIVEEGARVGAASGDVALRAGAGDARVAGLVEAQGASPGARGGRVTVHATGAATVEASGRIDVSGAGDGGDGGAVEVVSQNTVDVHAGAAIHADAGTRGHGGRIDLAGRAQTHLAASDVSAQGSAGGAAGVVASTAVETITQSARLDADGTDIKLIAFDSITLTPDAVINTRATAGDLADVVLTERDAPGALASHGPSGDILLQAPSIRLEGDGTAGARLLAWADNGFDAGDVTLRAANLASGRDCAGCVQHVALDVEAGAVIDAGAAGGGEGGRVSLLADAGDLELSGVAESSARVTVDGSVHAGDIELAADALAESRFTNEFLRKVADNELDLRTISSGDFAAQLGDDLAALANGFNMAWLEARADASVDVGGEASLRATGDVRIRAGAERTAAKSPAWAAGNALLRQLLRDPLSGLSATYANVEGTTRAAVHDGAEIDTGGSLRVTAESTNTGDASAWTLNYETNKHPGVSFGLLRGNVTTTAEVRPGARISGDDTGLGAPEVVAGDDLVIDAVNHDSLSAVAISFAMGQGPAALGAAVNLFESDARARLDASVGAGFDDTHVGAVANGVYNGTFALGAAGSGLYGHAFKMGSYASGAAKDAVRVIRSLFRNGVDQHATRSRRGNGPAEGKFKFGALVALSDTEQAASASIGDGVTIDAAGDVVVGAETIAGQVHNVATSGVGGTTEQSGGPKYGVSAGVAVASNRHVARAEIGAGANVTAERIAVDAHVGQPFEQTWTEWNGITDILYQVYFHIGAVGQFTSLALGGAAAGGDGSIGLGGSVNYFHMDNEARAWVDDGATLHTRAPGGGWSRDIELGGGGYEYARDWSEAVSVNALAELETLDGSGIAAAPFLWGNGAGDGGTAVGGSLLWTQYEQDAIAGVADGVTVTASSLGVDAELRDWHLVLAPNSGQSGGVGINGMVSFAQIDGTAHATISSDARILAREGVRLDASHRFSHWNVAGAVAYGSNAGVGAGAAVNDVRTDTVAAIGDNHRDDPDYVEGDPASEDNDTVGFEGVVETDSLSVNARNSGRVAALAVAGAASTTREDGSEAQSGDPDAGSSVSGSGAGQHSSSMLSSAMSKVGNGIGKAFGFVWGALNWQQVNDDGKRPDPRFNLAASGATAINLSELDARASIDEAAIRAADPQGVDVTVRTSGEVDLIAGAGSGALALSRNPSARSAWSAALGGAVALNWVENDLEARIRRSEIHATSDGVIEAVHGGDLLAVGLGMAIANNSGKKSVAFTGSASANITRNRVRARMLDATLDADPEHTAQRRLGLTAFDGTRTLSGAGGLGLSFSQGAAAGSAASIADIANTIEARIERSDVTGFQSVNVQALTMNRVLSAAAGMAGGHTSAGLAGSFYGNFIDNDVSAAVTGRAEDRSRIVVSDALNVAAHGVDAPPAAASVLEGPVRNAHIDFSGGMLTDNDSLTGAMDVEGAGGVSPLQGDLSGEVVLGAAGSFSGARNAFGIGVGVNAITTDYDASIEYTTVADPAAERSARTLEVGIVSEDRLGVVGMAAGLAGATNQLTAVGSVAANLVDADSRAGLGAGVELTAARLAIGAGNTGEILAFSGNVAVSRSGLAGGVAIGWNEVHGETVASIGAEANVDVSGDASAERPWAADIDAGARARIVSIAAGGQVGDDLAIGGSYNRNDVARSIRAEIGTAAALQATSLRLAARGGAPTRPGLAPEARNDIVSAAGNLGIATGTATVGAAWADNELQDTVSARVPGSELSVDEALRIDAQSADRALAVAVSLAGAKEAAGAAAGATNTVGGSVTARVADSRLDTAGADVAVVAAEDVQADAHAVTATGALGSVAIGGALASNRASRDIAAELLAVGSAHATAHVRDLRLQSASARDVKATAIAAAVAAKVGVAGAVPVNILRGSVLSRIGTLDDAQGNPRGSRIVAQDDIAILAGTEETADAGAGALGVGLDRAGVAFGTGVNFLDTTTRAGIEGVDTRVTALGMDEADDFQVARGRDASESATLIERTVGHAADGDFEAIGAGPESLQAGTERARAGINGLAVNAVSDQHTRAWGGGASAAFDVDHGLAMALTGLVQVNRSGGVTEAYIRDAAINADAAATAARRHVDVHASHYRFGDGGLGTLAVAAGAGFGGSAWTDLASHDTRAMVDGASVVSTGALAVDARAVRDLNAYVVGLGAGVVGGAGSVGVARSTMHTEAYVRDADIAVGDLGVHADSETTLFQLSGGFGASGVALGAGVNVAFSDITTHAWLDHVTGPAGAAQAGIATGTVAVGANTSFELGSIALAAALAGAEAYAGGVAVADIAHDTRAWIRSADITGAASLSVDAHESSRVDLIGAAAGLSSGGNGVGVGVTLLLGNSRVAAEVLDSTVDVSGAVSVDARRDLEAFAVSASAGLSSYSNGLAGSISALLLRDTDAATSDGDSATGALEEGALDHVNDNVAGHSGLEQHRDPNRSEPVLAADERQAIGDENTGELALASLSGPAPNVTARISGSQVAAAEVDVRADNRLATTGIAGALGAGSAVGAGAGLVFTRLDDGVVAELAASHIDAPRVTVHAGSGDKDGSGIAGEARAYVGAASPGAAMAAGVADVRVNTAVDARIAGDAIVTSADANQSLDVAASNTADARTHVVGAAIGSGAAGAVYGRSVRAGSVQATLGDGASVAGFGDVTLDARNDGLAEARGTAASAGMTVAGQAAVLEAEDDVDVTAEAASGSAIDAGGTVTIAAGSAPDVDAEATGGGLSAGASAGASVAEARSTGSANARFEGTHLEATHLRVESSFGDGSVTRSLAVAANGAQLAANAAVAQATDWGVSEAVVSGTLSVTGDLVVRARRDQRVRGETTGVVLGLAAAGAAVADVSAQGTTRVAFDGVMDRAARSVVLDAHGRSHLFGWSVSGSGGVVAGSAAETRIDDAQASRVDVGAGATIDATWVDILATQVSRFRGGSDSTQASAAGFSGALTERTIAADAIVAVADGLPDSAASVNGFGVRLATRTEVEKWEIAEIAPRVEGGATPGGSHAYSVNVGAGGVANGQAGDANLVVTPTSEVRVGQHSALFGHDHLLIGAGGSLAVDERARLASGGIIQAPVVDARVAVTGTTTVDVGADAQLLSGRFLGVAAAADRIDVDTQAVAKTWGVAGVADSHAQSDVWYAQRVDIGADAHLRALGNAIVTAGRNADLGAALEQTRYRVHANAEAVNNTAIPALSAADGVADLDAHTLFNLAPGARILAGEDVFIGAYERSDTSAVVGKGVARAPVSDVFSEVSVTRDERESRTSSTTIDGTVIGGYFNHWDLAVDGSGAVTFSLNGRVLDPAAEHELGEDPGAYLSINPALNTHDTLRIALSLMEQAGYGELGGRSAPDGEGGLAEQALDPHALTSADGDYLVRAVRLDQLVATQGDVTVHGDRHYGSGLVEARGGARITVRNDSPSWLHMGDLRAVDNPGGRVHLRGVRGTDADTSGRNWTVNEVRERAAPEISLRQAGGEPTGNNMRASSIIVDGVLRNPAGSITIEADSGNIYLLQTVSADRLELTAPNGSITLAAGNGTQHIGGNPWGNWINPHLAAACQDRVTHGCARAFLDHGQGLTGGGSDGDVGGLPPDYVVAYAMKYRLERLGVQTDGRFLSDELYAFEAPAGSDLEMTNNEYGYTLAPYNITGMDDTGTADPRHPWFPEDVPNTVEDWYALYEGEDRWSKWRPVINPELSYRLDYADGQFATDPPPAFRANTILLKADTLNINAPIEAGSTQEVALTVTEAMHAELLTLQPGQHAYWIREDPDQVVDAGWRFVSRDTPYSSLESLGLLPDERIRASFDAGAGRIRVHELPVGQAGHILLDGKIVASNRNGELRVLNGLGSISIENPTGLDLELPRISTGQHGGVIEIVDRLSNERTWYLNRADGSQDVIRTHDLARESHHGLAVDETVDGSTTYNPLPGVVYEWEREYVVGREVTIQAHTDAAGGYGEGFYASTASPWGWLAETPGEEWHQWASADTGTPRNGDVVREGLRLDHEYHLRGADYYAEVRDVEIRYSADSGPVTFHAWESIDGYGGCSFLSCIFNPDMSWKRYFDYPDAIRMTTLEMARADHAIGIEFAGPAAPEIDIESNGGVHLGGDLSNPGGEVQISGFSDTSDWGEEMGGSLTAAEDVTIRAGDLTVRASGAIGSRENPVAIDHAGSASGVWAKAGGNVHLEAPDGPLRVDWISTRAGAVNLSGAEGVLQQTTGRHTRDLGLNVLAAAGIRVDGGSGDVRLGVNPYDISAPVPYHEYGIEARADGDVHLERRVTSWIEHDRGDLAIVRVEAGGDVVLDAAGDIRAAALAPVLDPTDPDNQARMAALGVLGSDAQTDVDRAIDAYRVRVERAHRTYWQLDAIYPLAADGSRTLTDAGAALYANLAAASGETVEAHVSRRLETSRQLLAGVYGTDAFHASAEFQAASSAGDAFVYAVPEAVRNDLSAGSVWSEAALYNAVNAAALSAPEGAAWLDQDVLISGRDVTLLAGGRIGSRQSHVLQVAPGEVLGDADRLRLATAAPGSVEIVQDPATGSYTVSLDAVDRLRLRAQGEVHVDAGREAAIGAAGSMRLRRAEAGDWLYLAAEQDLLGYRETADSIAVVGGGADGAHLAAVQGRITHVVADENRSLGALPLDLEGPLLSAIAAGDIRLRNDSGRDLSAGLLLAGDTLRVVQSQGDLLQLQDRGFAWSGDAIHLAADAGNIGTALAPVHLVQEDTASGAIDLDAGMDCITQCTGDAWISTPASPEIYADDRVLDLRLVEVAGGFSVVGATTDVLLGNSVLAGGGVLLETSERIASRDWWFLDAGGSVSVTAGREAELSSITSAGSITARASTTLRVDHVDTGSHADLGAQAGAVTLGRAGSVSRVRGDLRITESGGDVRVTDDILVHGDISLQIPGDVIISAGHNGASYLHAKNGRIDIDARHLLMQDGTALTTSTAASPDGIVGRLAGDAQLAYVNARVGGLELVASGEIRRAPAATRVVRASGDLSLRATALGSAFGIDLPWIEAGGDILLESGGHVRTRTSTSGGGTLGNTANGCSATGCHTVDADGSVSVHSDAFAELFAVRAGEGISLATGGDLRVADRLEVTGTGWDVDVAADGHVHLGAGIANPDGDVQLSGLGGSSNPTGGDVTVDPGAEIHAGDIWIRSGGGLGTAAAPFAVRHSSTDRGIWAKALDGDAHLASSHGPLVIDWLQATGSVSLDGAVGVLQQESGDHTDSLGLNVLAPEGITIDGGAGDVRLGIHARLGDSARSALGSVAVRTDGSVVLERRRQSWLSGDTGDLYVRRIEAGGSVRVAADGSVLAADGAGVEFGTIGAGTDVDLDAVRDVVLFELDAGGHQSVSAGQRLEIEGGARVGGDALFHASDIRVATLLDTTVDTELGLDAAGAGGAEAAARVDLRVSGASAVRFDQLWAREAWLQTEASAVELLAARDLEYLHLATRDMFLLVDTWDIATSQPDVSLSVDPGTVFQLDIDGTHFVTDAGVDHLADGFSGTDLQGTAF